MSCSNGGCEEDNASGLDSLEEEMQVSAHF